MEKTKANIEALKQILENIHSPEELESHLWTKSLVVQDAVASIPELDKKEPGEQLIVAIRKLFPHMMPSSPPKRGKRLDTRWGEFGIMAAQYFAPLNYGTPYPTSLSDAWGRIDEAILLFVYGKSRDSLSEEEIELYKLVGDELEIGPTSTISDWHQKGIRRLTEIFLARERYLGMSSSKTSTILQAPQGVSHKNDGTETLLQTTKKYKRGTLKIRRITILVLSLILLIGLFLGGIKGWRIYTMGQKVRQDISELQDIRTSLDDLDAIETVGSRLVILRDDIQTLRHEAATVLQLAPIFSWVPVYGGDLSSARELLDLADYLSVSAVKIYQAAQPILHAYKTGSNALDPPKVSHLFVQAQPQVSEARKVFDKALIARNNIDVRYLSPLVSDLIVQDVDPILALMDDGLSVASSIPKLLGASSEGPKTYLILAQNEDELRPTGGFITAVANLVVRDGELISIKFEDSGDLEDWSKPYPVAPWQLNQYMNSHILVLRDSNWFTNFPTTALWAEYLYAYSRSHSVDGVIAFDQHLLEMMLRVFGPIYVDGAPYPITADNVLVYLRSAKEESSQAERPADWNRKSFLNPVASAALNKLITENSINWQIVFPFIFRALEERHLILKFDDPVLGEVINRHGWDGAVQTGNGDFLMVVDSNIGFNKTNAVVEGNLFYDIDLTEPVHPTSDLTIIRKNNASAKVPCLQWDEREIQGDNSYPIDRCYWNYLRVYVVNGGILLDASPPPVIPNAQTVFDRSMPTPRVDVLDEEIDGVQAFGTLMVVPGGKSVSATYHFALPSDILEYEASSNQTIYRLKVQKQPGTIAIPITIRVHLPLHSQLISAYPDALVQGKNILFTTNLMTDIEIQVVFSNQ